jgi:hypothetical protein
MRSALEIDTFYKKLLIRFLIKLDISVTIKTHTHARTHIGALDSVVDKALCYQPEGLGFETQWNE